MITNLCDVDPVMGTPDKMPKYFSEADVFVPHESNVNLVKIVDNVPKFIQPSAPFLQGEK